MTALAPKNGNNEVRVAIIGGGASGTMVARQLLGQRSETCGDAHFEIFLFEASGDFGPGFAYREPPEVCLMNVRAGNLSADPNDAGNFVKWLHAQNRFVHATEFVPRAWYGSYLRRVLEDATTASSHTLHTVDTKVLNLRAHEENSRATSRFELTTEDHKVHAVDAVVLATGNQSPKAFEALRSSSQENPRYIGQPLDKNALLGVEPSHRVLILGTGLTMVDTVLLLKARGHRGEIWAMSRRGLLPRTHVNTPKPYTLSDVWNRSGSLSELVHRLRLEMRRASDTGFSPNDVIDAFRSKTSKHWQALSLKDKKRFLHHLQVYWDAVRHRMAPSITPQLEQLQRERLLNVFAGRLERAEWKNHQFLVELQGRRVHGFVQTFDAIINCTSPDRDITTHPLLGSLVRQGLLEPDTLGLGIARAKAGLPIYWLGPLRVGELWESVAIPEIRVQAAEVAEKIASSAPSFERVV